MTNKVSSSMVDWTSPATGSTTRSLASKLQDVVSVLDFAGVDNTGATDSAAGVQAALDSGASAVHFPAGTYLIGTALTLPEDVQLIGEHTPKADYTDAIAGTVIKRSTNVNIITAIGTNRTTDRVGHNLIQSIAFEDASGAGTAGWISLKYADSLIFRDCSFYQATGITTTGISVFADECWDLRFDNCIWKQVGSASSACIGAYNGADNNCNGWVFTQCRWQECRGNAFLSDASGAGTSNFDMFFTNCKFEDTGKNAPRHINVTDGASNGSDRFHFVGCLFSSCDGYLAYSGTKGGEWIFTNCQFANGGKGETPKAYIYLQIPNCSITACNFIVPGASYTSIASYIEVEFTNSQNLNVIGCVETGGGAGTRGFNTYKLMDARPRYSQVAYNSDFRTITSGIATVLAAGTNVTVTHNIAVGTPLLHHITVTPADQWYSATQWWISTVTATTFRINTNVAPGTNLAFWWRVDMSALTE